MKLKTKLASLIIGFVMVASMLFFGVWAASSANVTLGGTISFNSTNVFATVTGSISGAATGDCTLDTLEFTSTNTPDTSTWANKNITFNETNLVTIKINIENEASDRPLYAKVTDTYGDVVNVTKTLDKTEAQTITEGTSVEFTITMKVDNPDLSVDTTGYGYHVYLSNDPIEATDVTLNYDATNNYYYVEMGTYNEAPVRWRLVSTDGKTKFNATSTAPILYKGQTGYFILETVRQGAIYDKPYDASDNNDYSSSDVRNYLTTESTLTDGTSFIGDLKIATTDDIYKNILARSISDLSVDAVWSEGPISNAEYSIKSGNDKIWLPSVKELYTMVGGGTFNGNGFSSQLPQEVYKNLMWYADISDDTSGICYYLRSPNLNNSALVYAWDFHGPFYSGAYASTGYAFRPMFCLTF